MKANSQISSLKIQQRPLECIMEIQHGNDQACSALASAKWIPPTLENDKGIYESKCLRTFLDCFIYYISKLGIPIISKSIKNKLSIPSYKGQNSNL